MTENGLKKITDVKIGERIYAFDQKTHELVLKECSGVFDNGIQDVYRLETLHHSIEATMNHPFLVRQRTSRGKGNCFVWKTLGEIKVGDEVVSLKKLPEGKSVRFDFNKTELGDYKVNRLNEVNIPEYSSPELMKYLGVYVGDGWIRKEKGEVGFALPEKSKARTVFMELHSQLFNTKIRQDKMYVYINSVNLANFIDSLGFGSGAKNKIIPSWVFNIPKEQKYAFIEGLMLSDGYMNGNSWRYVSASEDLLRTLRLFLQTMDFRVGKIHWQEKKKGTKCVKRELLNDSKYGYICFSRRNGWNIEKYPSQYRYQNLLIENEYFETVKVRKISYVGRKPTLDLRVEDEHNFIADGIVVHNTGIQRSGATPYGASTTTAPAGKILPGKLQLKKDLTAIAVAHRIPYVAQATIFYWRDLVNKATKALSVEGPSFLNVLSPCPRGWRFPPEKTVEISKLAVETGVWPLIEIENGIWRFTYKPSQKKPVEEWLKSQGRFKHLFEEKNKHLIQEIQKQVDEHLSYLEKLCSATAI
ncbi:MAG: LAGLIDADG family homing endonuclease [Endomicrobiia bacterium]